VATEAGLEDWVWVAEMRLHPICTSQHMHHICGRLCCPGAGAATAVGILLLSTARKHVSVVQATASAVLSIFGCLRHVPCAHTGGVGGRRKIGRSMVELDSICAARHALLCELLHVLCWVACSTAHLSHPACAAHLPQLALGPGCSSCGH
jgi:hypothetical protein